MHPLRHSTEGRAQYVTQSQYHHAPTLACVQVSGTNAARKALAGLAALGSTDAIAQHLRETGSRGHREWATGCPIAVYVYGRTGVAVGVTACRWRIWSDAGDWALMPGVVGEFIREFEHGRWPDLDVARCDHPAVAR